MSRFVSKYSKKRLTEYKIYTIIDRRAEIGSAPMSERRKPNTNGGFTMKSYMAKPGETERKWYVVDAEGMVLGRLAAQVAMILRGKNKPTFTPNVDTGDYVIVVNCDKVVLTGKKSQQKYYRYHTGYVGGLKEVRYDKLMKTKPEFVVRKAVKGMLPKNSLGRQMITKLHVYAGAEHKHEAQKPEALKLK